MRLWITSLPYLLVNVHGHYQVSFGYIPLLSNGINVVCFYLALYAYKILLQGVDDLNRA